LPAEALRNQDAVRAQHDPAGLAESLRRFGLGRMPSTWRRLGALDIPVTVAVGEQSAGRGPNADPENNDGQFPGAVYTFERRGAVWAPQQYIKTPNNDADDFLSVFALSGDRLLIANLWDDSGSRSVGGDPFDESREDSGAAWIYERVDGTWVADTFLKASNADEGDGFGTWAVLDGDRAVVSSFGEQSLTGEPDDNSGTNVGAVYVYELAGGQWSETAYLKPSNPIDGLAFGFNLALDGDTLAVSATGDPRDPGAGPDDRSMPFSGAVYVFRQRGGEWVEEAYLRAPNAGAGDSFGTTSLGRRTPSGADSAVTHRRHPANIALVAIRHATFRRPSYMTVFPLRSTERMRRTAPGPPRLPAVPLSRRCADQDRIHADCRLKHARGPAPRSRSWS
jgi:hypothetical protein